MKKSLAEQAAAYIAEKQKEIGLALLILMQKTNATDCTYETALVGKGKTYKITTTIEEQKSIEDTEKH
jgi:hypothetical protein